MKLGTLLSDKEIKELSSKKLKAPLISEFIDANENGVSYALRQRYNQYIRLCAYYELPPRWSVLLLSKSI